MNTNKIIHNYNDNIDETDNETEYSSDESDDELNNEEKRNLVKLIENTFDQAYNEASQRNEDEYIPQLLESILNVKEDSNERIFEQTMEDLNQIKRNVIYNLSDLDDVTKEIYIEKLEGYKYVNDLVDLAPDTYVRWIHINNNVDTKKYLKLNAGGKLLDIDFTEKGVVLRIFLIRGRFRRVIKANFDNLMLFQKLTYDEKLIMEVMKLCD